ncbi:MAG: hypothetical protein BMS9Abin15_0989 [Gammaproteobacteria bacterium]|nr:MAG: hypothetical protein BMS9Abin15_0989 [Gammaproteobacteria bacterium]
MGWTTIGTAILLGAMLVYVFPRMRQAMKNSPKGTTSDWMGVLIPIVGVILFVILLIKMV